MIISLGRHCQAAHQIRRVFGRASQPQFFDWLITPHKGLVGLLDSRFDGFLASDEIAVDGAHDGFHRVIDQHTGIEVLHDFPATEEVSARLPVVQAKFAHLARRFLALNDADFVRQVEIVDADEEGELRAMLTGLFADRYRLTMISDENVAQSGPYVWSGDDAAWDRVLGSIPSQTGSAPSLHRG